MKLLALAWHAPPTSRTPGSPRLFSLCRELAERHEIELIMLADTPERREAFLSDPDTPRVFRRIDEVPPRGAPRWLGRQVHRVASEPWFSTRHLDPAYYRRVRELVRARSGPGSGVDLVLADGLETTQYVPELAIPAFAELHDSLSLLCARRAAMESGLERLRLRLEARAMARWEGSLGRRFARIVTNSEVDAEAIRRLDPGCPVLGITNGVDTDYFSPDPAAAIDPAHLVFTGVMDYRPNADAACHFIRAVLPLVREKVAEAEFWAVGHAPLPELVRLGEGAGIHVTGTVDDVRDYVRPARAFLCPLRYGTGIKNKILAAMAMGKPVVATPISLDGIDAEPETEVLVGDTPERFAAQVVRVMQDDALAARLGANARRRVVESYSWRTRAEALETEMLAAVAER